MIKTGKTSAPGISSIKVNNPIQRKRKMQNRIPTMSIVSPARGIVRIAAAYSITSSTTQNTNETISISVKTKYWGTRTLFFVFLSRMKSMFFTSNFDFIFKSYFNRSIKHNCIQNKYWKALLKILKKSKRCGRNCNKTVNY
jgi:hypothetical protein